MNSIKQLHSRFPYMFSRKHNSFCCHKGWLDIFSSVCEEIDQALRHNKHGFHWVQVKEKLGAARFYWQLQADEETGQPSLIKQQISALVEKAVERTANTCIVCGETGALDQSAPHLLTLCAQHAAERKAGVELLIEISEA